MNENKFNKLNIFFRYEQKNLEFKTLKAFVGNYLIFFFNKYAHCEYVELLYCVPMKILCKCTVI